MDNERVSIKQCRDLRKLTAEFTRGCILTVNEYQRILAVYAEACDRLEKEGVIDENRA